MTIDFGRRPRDVDEKALAGFHPPEEVDVVLGRDRPPPRSEDGSRLPAWQLRAHFMYRAIFWAVGSGICTCLLVIIMFTSALLKFQHEVGAAVLFILAMGLFTTALIYLAREVRLSHRNSFRRRGIGAASARRSSPLRQAVSDGS